MPPKAKEPADGDATDGIDQFELPRAVIQRLSKGAVPAEAILAKDFIAGVGTSASVFISCQELAQANKQKTISAAHVLDAIERLDWPDSARLRKELTKELEIFRAGTGTKRARAPKAAATETAADDATEPATLTDDDVPAEAGPIDLDAAGTSSEDETALA